jgi:hypothetical protein
MIRLARKVASRDPLRVALGEAIGHHVAAKAAIETAVAAEQRATQFVTDLATAKVAAERELEVAKQAQVDAITRGETAPPLRAARSKLLDIEDELDAARQAHQALVANVAEARAELEEWRPGSENTVRTAAAQVLYAEAGPLRARAATLQRELFIVQAQLRWVADQQPDRSHHAGASYDPELSALLRAEPPDARALQAEALAPFEGALAALMIDADAPLPD